MHIKLKKLLYLALCISVSIGFNQVQAVNEIYKESFPGVTVKVLEVQGPNITDLGGSIPALHQVQISANTKKSTILKKLTFVNINNMDSQSIGSQDIFGLHLERVESKSIEIMLAPDNSAKPFQWKAIVEYSHNNSTYSESFKVNSSAVKIKKPRFHKDDGLDALSLSLGLGVLNDSVNTPSGDIFSGLESELNLGGSQQGTMNISKHGMDIALRGVEEHVDQMRTIRKHKHKLSREKRNLLSNVKKMNNDLRHVASVHQAQDEKARQQAIARAEAEKKGGFQWGKLAAMATGAAIGGLGDLDASQQMDFISSMVQDSRAGVDGMSSSRSTIDRMSAELANQRNSKNSGSVSSGSSDDNLDQKSTTFSVTCSSNKTPFKYYTEDCRKVAAIFTQVYACNEIDKMDKARTECERMCGDPTCEEF